MDEDKMKPREVKVLEQVGDEIDIVEVQNCVNVFIRGQHSTALHVTLHYTTNRGATEETRPPPHLSLRHH